MESFEGGKSNFTLQSFFFVFFFCGPSVRQKKPYLFCWVVKGLEITNPWDKQRAASPFPSKLLTPTAWEEQKPAGIG